MKHEIIVIATDQVRVVIEGEVDMHVAPALRTVLHEAVAAKPALLRVDLAAVPFMDSSGIATLVEALKTLRKWSGSLRVENSQETVRDTFEIAGLSEILGVV